MIGERLAAPERLRRLLALLLLAVPACMVARLWLDPAVAWMHPEAANIAAWGTVAGSPPEGITLDRLSTIPLELEAEGPRPRILSVSTEAGEAILRPAWTAVLGPHPSIAPLGLLTAVFAPFLFFRWLRLRHVGSVRAAALTAVLLTSTFMLSVLIPYIRPAKKYTILWACLAFYLAERHRAKRTLGLFWLLVIVLGLAFFSDEEGYFLAPMVALIYAPSLLRGTPFWQRALVLGLPVLCFAGAQYGLALVVAGHDGGAAWDVLALPQHFGYNPAAFVLNPDFWPSAAGQVARNLLTVVGIYRHTRLTEAISLVVALAAVAASVLALRRHAGAGHLQYQLTAATAVLAISGLYLTALDWWPREQNSPNFYVSSFGYYYRSSAVVLLVVWLALLWDAALQALGQASEQLRTVVAVGGVVA
ncbi:MAG: hypothetical protein JO023_21730, partial [Chloroflexi bacterium]|nr:hypothetical protein [Chloroflexota bacterium]